MCSAEYTFMKHVVFFHGGKSYFILYYFRLYYSILTVNWFITLFVFLVKDLPRWKIWISSLCYFSLNHYLGIDMGLCLLQVQSW